MTSGAEAVLGFIRRLLIASVLACLLVAIFATTALANGVVPTDKGPVRGTETQSVEKFLGIPYAAPPVAELRWRPPQPPTRWHGPRDATDFGNHCPQPGTPFGSESASEDCLYLNVFKPNRGPGRGHTKHLPVMVWIHGGGFVAGMSEDYDPSRLVERGVVVVTLNYRLGYLGFLAHERLSAESNYGGSGNYGLMDQQAALRWVDRNIKKFGGDPENVTIFGESAGGLSVHAHLVSPLAAGLFDRAIVQSGAYSLSQPSLSEAEQSGSNVAAILAASSWRPPACARRRSMTCCGLNRRSRERSAPTSTARSCPDLFCRRSAAASSTGCR
jgi:para-nitrobenzyl esterase